MLTIHPGEPVYVSGKSSGATHSTPLAVKPPWDHAEAFAAWRQRCRTVHPVKSRRETRRPDWTPAMVWVAEEG